MLHRTRHLFIRQQTAVINSIRAQLAEFGIVAPVGRKGVEELLHVVADPSDKRVPDVARACPLRLGFQLLASRSRVAFDRMIMAWHRCDETSKRLRYIPGVCLMLATALVASVADPKVFRSGRTFSAWMGCRGNTEAGARTNSAVSASKVTAICAVYSWQASLRVPLCEYRRHQTSALAYGLVGSKPTKVAAVAPAKKLARMAWAMITRGERYKQPVALAA